MSKARVIVLGGCGFIGRNFVKFLVENDKCSKILVCDKVLPATAHFTPKIDEIFKNEVVEFKQTNLTSDASIEKSFSMDGGEWDFIFNLAAETKLSQAENVYQEKVLDLSKKCALAATKHGCKLFIEMSTAWIYSAGKKKSNETSKTNPSVLQAKYKLLAEQELAKIEGLNFLIVRPAIVYGPADITGITPRLITGAVYRYLGEKMKFLWSGDLKINTIHVEDVSKAMWFLTEKGVKGEVYNLVDKSDSDQGKLNKLLESMFDIKTGFTSSIMNGLAKMSMKTAVEQVNDKHLKPWADLCKEAGIAGTPLTPYLDLEVLQDNPLSIDGSKIEGLGFELTYPVMTKELLTEVLDEYIGIGLFPAIDKIPQKK